MIAISFWVFGKHKEVCGRIVNPHPVNSEIFQDKKKREDDKMLYVIPWMLLVVTEKNPKKRICGQQH